MRIVTGVLFVFITLFAVVQHDDPDGAFWAVVYAVPAIWCALAAFQPTLLRRPLARGLLVASFVAAVVGTIHFWPAAEQFWRIEVWWEDEDTREGMGMTIVATALAICLFAAFPLRRRASRPEP